jgi:hypothetical protein
MIEEKKVELLENKIIEKAGTNNNNESIPKLKSKNKNNNINNENNNEFNNENNKNINNEKNNENNININNNENNNKNDQKNKVQKLYQNNFINTKQILSSTASPYKFYYDMNSNNQMQNKDNNNLYNNILNNNNKKNIFSISNNNLPENFFKESTPIFTPSNKNISSHNNNINNNNVNYNNNNINNNNFSQIQLNTPNQNENFFASNLSPYIRTPEYIQNKRQREFFNEYQLSPLITPAIKYNYDFDEEDNLLKFISPNSLTNTPIDNKGMSIFDKNKNIFNFSKIPNDNFNNETFNKK